MRLFISIDLPKEIKDYLFNLQKEVREAKINWVSKKNLHLTLKFLGEVDEDKIPEIIKAIKEINYPSFEVSLTNLGFFPSKEKPKVIWVGLDPEDKVIDLQQKVDEALLTVVPTEQQFQAHLTLGRIKLIRREKDFQKSLENISIENKKFKITSFKLMKSELRRSGADYGELENVDLS
jgi:RNA 2',3'-cyclic 3'-phosphodiesterase